MHISFHQICDNVDVLVSSWSRWLLHVDEGYNVLVVEELKQLNFTDDTLSLNKIFEGFRHFFDGTLNFCLVIIGTADYTICTMADLFNVFKFFIYNKCRAYINVRIQNNAYPHTQM